MTWWWLPYPPSGKIELWLEQPAIWCKSNTHTVVHTELDVGEFDQDWPYRFAEIHQFYADQLLPGRPNGLQPGDIIVAGWCSTRQNAGLIVDLSDKELEQKFRHCIAISLKMPNLKILQWPTRIV